MTYTDTKLKQTLAKMLPESVRTTHSGNTLLWLKQNRDCLIVLDTELLHLCWLVEETLAPSRLHKDSSLEWCEYVIELGDINTSTMSSNIHATWQQRTIALAKVKGIEIV